MNQLEIYFETVPLEKKRLREAQMKAGKQNSMILSLYRAYSQYAFSPSDVYSYFDLQWPITSIRRAITTLTDLGYLEKTGTFKQGMFGKPENLWRLKQ